MNEKQILLALQQKLIDAWDDVSVVLNNTSPISASIWFPARDVSFTATVEGKRMRIEGRGTFSLPGVEDFEEQIEVVRRRLSRA